MTRSLAFQRVIKLTVAPQLTSAASFDIIGQIQEGFDNVPGYFGADVRRRGKVDSLRSGVKEGAKGFAYGLADGLTGLVTEPVKGAKEGVSAYVPRSS